MVLFKIPKKVDCYTEQRQRQKKEFRGKGYASEGLRLTIEKAWHIIKEDEIYMSVHRDNTASLRVQIKNGAYIHHQDEKEFYTRINDKFPFIGKSQRTKNRNLEVI